ncbi:MAG: hypothetical protein HKN82_16195 [Akkermansiaceae bacterium]|nr:hypothetical protein [Akkermansiaceae bacterium]
MRGKQDELEAANVAVAVVTFDHGPMAEAYVRETGLQWPLLLDRDRGLYRACGMMRGKAWDLYGPPAIRAYLKLMARGRRLHRPGSDVTQLGGDVLVDPGGIVRLHHVGSGPADRPSIGSILGRVREGAGS